MLSRLHTRTLLFVAGWAALSLAACPELTEKTLPRHAALDHRRATWVMLEARREPPARLAEAISRLGKLAIPLDRPETVLAELAAGHVVVVGHGDAADGMACGYDLDSDSLLLFALSACSVRLALAGWNRAWSHSGGWGVAVLGPGELPARPEPASYLQAADRLEQAGSPWEAVLAYDAGVAQWPNNAGVRAGLAQSLYELGAVSEAVDTFATAVSLSVNGAERQRIRRSADGWRRPLAPTPASAVDEKPLSGLPQ